jgi:GPH family glycoside/pentoside/hexuronide:cation symporter
VLGINFTTRFIMAVLVAVLPFYADHVLRIKEEELTELLIALFVTSGVSVLLWQRAVRRYGTRASMIASMGSAAILAIPLLFARSLLATGVALALLGTSIGGIILGPDMLFAEVVDEDYVRTGTRREGTYRGILGFIFRFPPALAGLILGEGLALAGFNSELSASAQPEAVTTVIRLFSAVIPIIALVAGIGLLLIYPLSGKYLRDIQERAALLREAVDQRFEHETPAVEGLESVASSK